MLHAQYSEPEFRIVPAGRDRRLLQATLSRNAVALTTRLTVDIVKPMPWSQTLWPLYSYGNVESQVIELQSH